MLKLLSFIICETTKLVSAIFPSYIYGTPQVMFGLVNNHGKWWQMSCIIFHDWTFLRGCVYSTYIIYLRYIFGASLQTIRKFPSVWKETPYLISHHLLNFLRPIYCEAQAHASRRVILRADGWYCEQTGDYCEQTGDVTIQRSKFWAYGSHRLQ